MGQLDLGNLKGMAIAARAAKKGICAGTFRMKLMELDIKAHEATGVMQAISKWKALAGVSKAEGETDEDYTGSLGKDCTVKQDLEGKNATFGKPAFAQMMQEICSDTGHDLDTCSTIADYKRLFLELQAYVVIKQGVGKRGKTNPAYVNWYFKKDVAPTAPAQAPAPTAPAQNWTQQAPPVAPAPEPAPAPAAPQPAASALFGD